MQSARVRPEPTPQRQAAITHGAVFDHAGSVQVAPLADFDLNRTIFQTLEGGLPRAVMSAQVGKEVVWDARVAKRVKVDYDAILEARPLPPVDPALLDFMVDQCDFDVEHADGSFLDHLYYCTGYPRGRSTTAGACSATTTTRPSPRSASADASIARQPDPRRTHRNHARRRRRRPR